MPTFIYNKCPICQNANYKIIGRSDLGEKEIEKPQKSEVVKCLKCNSLFVNPLPVWSTKDLNTLYSDADSYFIQTKRWNEIKEKKNVEARANFIKKKLKTEQKSMLEVGAGIDAFMGKRMNEEGWEVTLQEPSKNYASKLKKRFPSLRIIDSNFLEMDEDKKYAVIYIDSVLEHVHNPLDYLVKATKLLHKGGILYSISPNEHSFKNWIKMRFKKKNASVSYLCPYTESYHLIGFSKAGFQILSAESGLKIAKYIKKYDYEWFHILERKHGISKYIVAVILYFFDLIGKGTNQEIVFIKE